MKLDAIPVLCANNFFLPRDRAGSRIRVIHFFGEDRLPKTRFLEPLGQFDLAVIGAMGLFVKVDPSSTSEKLRPEIAIW